MMLQHMFATNGNHLDRTLRPGVSLAVLLALDFRQVHMGVAQLREWGFKQYCVAQEQVPRVQSSRDSGHDIRQ